MYRINKFNLNIKNQCINIEKKIGIYNEEFDKYFYILKINKKEPFIKLGVTNNYLYLSIKNIAKKYYYNQFDILMVAKCKKPIYYKQILSNKIYNLRINNNITRDCYIFNDELKLILKKELINIKNKDNSIYIDPKFFL